jgi:XPG I-region
MFIPCCIGWLKDSRSLLKVSGSIVIWYIVKALFIGIAYWLCFAQASGGAEAELAYLNKILAIDLVFTSDSDIFLFGATHVMRRSVKIIIKCLICCNTQPVHKITKTVIMLKYILLMLLQIKIIGFFQLCDFFYCCDEWW